MAMDIKRDVNSDVEAMATDMASTIQKPKIKSSGGGSKGLKVVITVLVVVILLVAAGFALDKFTDVNLFGENNGSGADASEYSAVFLSNGQVYFGVLDKGREGNTTLSDIYYLQSYNPPLQQAPTEQAVGQPQLSLVKLGNELHGPRDYMEINDDHIVFIEKLKTDSKVVEAISKYKESLQPVE